MAISGPVKNVLKSRKELETHFAETFEYDFSSVYCKDTRLRIIQNTPKLASLEDLTEEEYKALGMTKISHDVRLIPLWLTPFLAPSMEVVSFSGKTSTVKDCDKDNRNGYTAYGIKVLGMDDEFIISYLSITDKCDYDYLEGEDNIRIKVDLNKVPEDFDMDTLVGLWNQTKSVEDFPFAIQYV